MKKRPVTSYIHIIIIIIIITITMYCNNNFKGKYGATVGPKFFRPPPPPPAGNQDYRGTTVVSCHTCPRPQITTYFQVLTKNLCPVLIFPYAPHLITLTKCDNAYNLKSYSHPINVIISEAVRRACLTGKGAQYRNLQMRDRLAAGIITCSTGEAIGYSY